MTPTEELRELLDAAGVRWKRVRGHKSNGTSWYDKYGCYAEAIQEYAWDGGEFPEGKMVVRRGPAYMTPEQAIAVTLGYGECRMRLVYEEEDADGFVWPDHYECSVCGANVNGIMTSYDTEIPPRFCPNCGRKVMGE